MPPLQRTAKETLKLGTLDSSRSSRPICCIYRNIRDTSILLLLIVDEYVLRLDANRDASQSDPVRLSAYNIIIRLSRDGQFNARYLRSLIASPPPVHLGSRVRVLNGL